MKSFVSLRRIIAAAIILCLLATILLWARGWHSSDQSLPQAGQADTALSDSSTDSSSSSSTSFTVPIEGGQNTSGARRPGDNYQKSTATVAVKAKTPSAAAPIIVGSGNKPDPTPPPANSAPVLTTVLPASGTYLADALDGSVQYKALVFSATATDNEDGSITNPLSFHWSNLTANCSIAGTDLCENEKDGNNFTMNMPVSGVCPGVKSIDLSEDYKFKVAVQDSEGLIDSREIDLTITYHCVADPGSIPQITISSPSSVEYISNYFDDWLQPYSKLLFSATVIDAEDGAITDPSAYTWRLVDGYCSEVMATGDISCQTEVAGNNFNMNMMGGCVYGSGDTDSPREYVFELSVQDGDGNVATEQVAFSVAAACGDQGN